MNIPKISKWLISLLLLFSITINSQWIEKPFPINDQTDDWLNIVRFVTPETGWVVSTKHIYKTTNGGNSWNIIDTVYSIWKGFHAIDDSTLLVADYERGIRRSEDGGDSWTTIDSTILGVNSFMFLNRKFGFAAGGVSDTADVYRTLDGGNSWTRIAHQYIKNDWIRYSDFSKVSFIDSKRGWAVTYGGMIFRTTDGGFNWDFLNSTAARNGAPLRDIQFTTPDSGWVIGGIAGFSFISRTVYKGLNWISWMPLFDGTDITTASLREIYMLNSKVGWIVGSYNGPAYIMKTTDGGVTWIDETPKNEYYGFESISMLDSLHGFSVADYAFYETTNGGKITDVSSKLIFNEKFNLSQNYPNPFNPSTTIYYSVPEESKVTIAIFDNLGKEIKTLVDDYKAPGEYTIKFDASGLASGIYFYQLKTKDFVSTRKAVYLK